MDNKEHKIVLGTFFGDEGKGNVVQWLCQSNPKPIVHRFSGGPQAGHRVVLNGKSHVCSSWGSGVLLGVPTYLNENVFVDPICIVNEYKTLINEGIEVPPLYIDQECKVITPYDVLSDSINSEVKKDGTCGKGIHATFKRYEHCEYESICIEYALCINDEDFSILLDDARRYYKFQRDTELDKLFEDACKFIESHPEIFQVVPWSPTIDRITCDDYNTIIWEGSQGLLLDMERGFMPHCTPSKTGLNGIPEYILKESPEVYLVMRPYLTRHGNGFEPDDWHCKLSDYFTLEEPTNIDTGPQGEFKRGIFEFNLLNTVFNRHCLDNFEAIYKCTFNMVVTHWDCIKKEVIPVLDINGQYTVMTKHEFMMCLGLQSCVIKKSFVGLGVDSNIVEYEEGI